MNKKKLLEVTNEDLVFVEGSGHTGIFESISHCYPKDEQLEPILPEWFHTISLDKEYYFNHSGDKPISPIVKRFIDKYTTDGVLDSGTLAKLAQIIYDKYAGNWDKLYSAYFAEYEPIENYNMIEKYTYNSSNTLSGTDETQHGTTVHTVTNDDLTHGMTDTESGSIELEHGESIDMDGTNTLSFEDRVNERSSKAAALSRNNTYAFNTSDGANPQATADIAEGAQESGTDYTITDSDTHGVPQNHSIGENKASDREEVKGTETNTIDTTEAHTGTDTTTYNSHAHAITGTDQRDVDVNSATTGSDFMKYGKVDTHGGYDDHTRHGNIGVTTSQQMIEAEEHLRLYNHFMDVVFANVDSILCLRVY